MARNSDRLPEVYLSNALEVAHNPRSVSLEVCPSNTPELDRDPRSNPPEVIIAQGLERVDKISNKKAEHKEGGTKRRHTITLSFDWLYIKWRWIAVLAGILCIGGIAGGVGGGLRHKPSTVSGSFITSRSLFPNTSIAAATCSSGDRWIFLQESIDGNITAAHYLYSSSTWIFTSGYNFQNAKLGTALSASCVEPKGNQSQEAFRNSQLNFSLLISLVYLNDSNAVQQSILINETWSDSPVYPAASSPENNTKLSISTSICNEGELPPSFYSVATYESGLSFIMINLDPTYNNPRRPHTNENLLSQLQAQSAFQFEGLYTEIGFACVYSNQAPVNPSTCFTRCYYQYSTEPDSQIHNDIWEYDLLELEANITINATVFNSSYPDLSPPASVNADILIVPLLDNQSGLVFLNVNSTLGISIGSSYINNDIIQKNTDLTFPTEQTSSSPSAIPFPHLAATSQGANSTNPNIYMYYQLNDTAIAEVTYDTANKTWSTDPTIISFAQFFNESGGYIR